MPTLVIFAALGKLPFALFVGLISAIGMYEFTRMVRSMNIAMPRLLLILAALVTPIAVHYLGERVLVPAVLLAVLGVFILRMREPTRRAFEDVASSALGTLYLPAALSHLVLLRDRPVDDFGGFNAVMFLFLLTWACDTGAFAVGRRFGRHRPWPRLSPKKTLEGSIGGIVASVIAAFVARALVAQGLGLGTTLGFGLLLGVVCQVGDFMESFMKRNAGVKDTSRLIPGHGGVLDRFDSTIVSAPVTYYVVVLMYGRM